jgi:GTPase SAR1 family protein
MAIIRAKTGEIQCKIVYYGPGRCGKTTNLIMIHRAVGTKVRGDLISINTAGDKTIFFDFLPMDLGQVKNLNIKISVYTVPGQVTYNETRRLVLKGADGVVFVADSLDIRRSQNLESFKNLQDNLREHGLSFSNIAMVLQFNKRDLNGGEAAVMPISHMQEDLNPYMKWPYFEASAINGDGVKETFKSICMLTVANVCRQFL